MRSIVRQAIGLLFLGFLVIPIPGLAIYAALTKEPQEVPQRPSLSSKRGFVYVHSNQWNWQGEKEIYLTTQPNRLGIKFERLGVCNTETYKELEKRDNEAVEVLGYKCHWGENYSWITVLEVRTINGPLPYEEEELTEDEL